MPWGAGGSESLPPLLGMVGSVWPDGHSHSPMSRPTRLFPGSLLTDSPHPDEWKGHMSLYPGMCTCRSGIRGPEGFPEVTQPPRGRASLGAQSAGSRTQGFPAAPGVSSLMYGVSHALLALSICLPSLCAPSGHIPRELLALSWDICLMWGQVHRWMERCLAAQMDG